jgi:hypothetical protein
MFIQTQPSYKSGVDKHLALRIFLAPGQRLKNDLVFVGSGNMQQESL